MTILDAQHLWNPLDETSSANPYPALHRMRESDPVYYYADFGFWMLTRYDDCEFALNSKDIGIGREATLRELALRTGGGTAYEYMSRRLSHYDPPDHGRLRGTAQAAFTRRRLSVLTPFIERLVAGLLDAALAGDGEFELMDSLARHVPAHVISELLGLPEADRDLLRQWTTSTTPLVDPFSSPAELAVAIEFAEKEWAYLDAWLTDRERRPAGDDITGIMLAAQQAGRITRPELIAFLMFMFTAGQVTTRDLLGLGVLAMLREEGQWTAIVEDPALVPAAVTEMLRYDTSAFGTQRRALSDTVIGGVKIPSGALIVVATAAANRDPSRFPDPDRFDLRRPDNRPLSFGGGIHHCLGAHLARLETEIALAALARRCPQLKLAGQEITYTSSRVFRGPRAVRLSAR